MSKVINILNKEYPNKYWKAQRNGFNWQYISQDGWIGRYCADLSEHYGRIFVVYDDKFNCIDFVPELNDYRYILSYE